MNGISRFALPSHSISRSFEFTFLCARLNGTGISLLLLLELNGTALCVCRQTQSGCGSMWAWTTLWIECIYFWDYFVLLFDQDRVNTHVRFITRSKTIRAQTVISIVQSRSKLVVHVLYRNETQSKITIQTIKRNNHLAEAICATHIAHTHTFALMHWKN